jgi:hypothetical protein
MTYTHAQRALSFLGGSILVTPTHIELVFRDDDAQYADDNPAYRVLVIPESEREQIAKFIGGCGVRP